MSLCYRPEAPQAILIVSSFRSNPVEVFTSIICFLAPYRCDDSTPHIQALECRVGVE